MSLRIVSLGSVIVHQKTPAERQETSIATLVQALFDALNGTPVVIGFIAEDYSISDDTKDTQKKIQGALSGARLALASAQVSGNLVFSIGDRTTFGNGYSLCCVKVERKTE